MAAAIEKSVSGAKIELLEGGRGVFTVVADGKEVWNKHEIGAFPSPSEIVKRLAAG